VSIQRKLVLASASPRRAEILRNAGFEFEVIPAHIDESRWPDEAAPAFVQRLAEAKARAVASRVNAEPAKNGCMIVAADTVVAVDGEILGKPGSAEEARKMLRRLSGKWHEVLTGLAVMRMHAAGERPRVVVEKTRVEFAELANAEIEEYVKTGEPFDKAGAYAIQGRGGKFIPRIKGCYFNVMGLPLARLYEILNETEAVHV
jgi:nucleoside triphosphate pyrophosphatase